MEVVMAADAERLVREFVEEILSGDWNALRDFDFKTLNGSEKFGCPDRYFDCDDTNIMRAVYVVLWGDFLPNLNMDNFGFQKQYRGDTINTFHTMFGRKIDGRPGLFAGLEKYSPSDALREKVRRFGTICCNIGNYVVLPNYFARQTSLNCYRGTNDWHDFFDRFLIELHKVQTHSSGQDGILKELVKVNDFCFGKFRGDENFKVFTDTLFLDDYCNGSGIPKEVFAMNYHWKNENEPEQYIHDAGLYLTVAEKIIRSRAEKMIELLKRKIL